MNILVVGDYRQNQARLTREHGEHAGFITVIDISRPIPDHLLCGVSFQMAVFDRHRTELPEEVWAEIRVGLIEAVVVEPRARKEKRDE